MNALVFPDEIAGAVLVKYSAKVDSSAKVGVLIRHIHFAGVSFINRRLRQMIFRACVEHLSGAGMVL